MADQLDRYRRKRTPGATPEPFERGSTGTEPIFVVQRHDARSLHYDFRLERDGALASWAVPKGVPLDPGGRALAVHVEDHPLSYATFAGEIPRGQYGAGTVEVWDHGTYELLEEKRDGGLKVRLHGTRLEGTWTLVPAHLDGKEQNWLLIRGKDAPAPAVDRYAPMLATLAGAVPEAEGWSFELKFDGFRALAYLDGGSCTLRSRNAKDLTARFPDVAEAIAKAVAADAVLDGEICALDESGRPSFSAMQTGSGTLVYYAFDVLEVDGETVVGEPLTARRVRLAQLLGAGSAAVRLSEAFDDGVALFAAAQAQRLEGVVAKRDASAYVQGRRTGDWLKVKTHGRQEFLVAGYTRGQGGRAASFGSLLLAVREGDELRYVGNVGTGFDGKEIDRLLRLLRPLRRETSPFDVVPKLPRVRRADIVWVEPQLVAEVAFSEWTHDGRLRQASYQGLRDDKAPQEVRREASAPGPVKLPRRGAHDVKLSNLDKLFWPDEGITKGELVEYYRAVAPVLLPHLRERPFTMRRYPDGAFGKAFFQKDAPPHMPDWIPTFRAEVSTRAKPPARKWVSFPVVNDEDALAWMVNMGCIDMNPWLSRVDRPDRPDAVLFDLDPSPGTPWSDTVQVARFVRELLEGLGLASFPKTSGGKGIHILVPLDRRSAYDDVRAFAELIAGTIARAHPGQATTQWAKARRQGVLIDANQNGEGKTLASAYSVRPHPGAPVSTPLRWDEVGPSLDPAAFTMAVVLERVAREGDLHGGVLTTRQSLSKALKRL